LAYQGAAKRISLLIGWGGAQNKRRGPVGGWLARAALSAGVTSLKMCFIIAKKRKKKKKPSRALQCPYCVRGQKEADGTLKTRGTRCQPVSKTLQGPLSLSLSPSLSLSLSLPLSLCLLLGSCCPGTQGTSTMKRDRDKV